MSRRKKEDVKSEMSKPKFKIGEIVTVNFVGRNRECELVELKRHKNHPDRWIYNGIDIQTKRFIPNIGIDGSEHTANIYTENFKRHQHENDSTTN